MTRKDLKGNSNVLIWGVVSVFDWRDLQKPWETSGKVAGVKAKIWPWHLPGGLKTFLAEIWTWDLLYI
jgi:hypothetical protein